MLPFHAPRLKNVPVIDGDLSDQSWKEATKITRFYQNIKFMRTVPAEGNSDVYFGYTDTDLYIAVKGYEESTKDLTAEYTVRDENIWTDDCAEVFFDTDHDYNTFYQIIVNCIGTIADYAWDAESHSPSQANEWNAAVQVGTEIKERFWALEIRIPLKDLGVSRVKKGDIWGFNVARVRIAYKGEYDQWVPTYGYSLRPDRFGFLIFD